MRHGDLGRKDEKDETIRRRWERCLFGDLTGVMRDEGEMGRLHKILNGKTSNENENMRIVELLINCRSQTWTWMLIVGKNYWKGWCDQRWKAAGINGERVQAALLVCIPSQGNKTFSWWWWGWWTCRRRSWWWWWSMMIMTPPALTTASNLSRGCDCCLIILCGLMRRRKSNLIHNLLIWGVSPNTKELQELHGESSKCSTKSNSKLMNESFKKLH